MDDPRAKLPFRLLACDLDGTLIGDDMTLSPRVRQALAQAQARGVQVTLATGRSFPDTLPFARALNISLPLICYQGGVIKHPVSGELFYRATMPRALVLEVIALARVHDWHLVLYLDEALYLEDLRRPRHFYDGFLGGRINLVDDLATVVQKHPQEPDKFVFVAEERTADRIQAVLGAQFAQFDRQMVVVRSHSLFVEGNPLSVNKGAALEWLAGYLNVSQAQVMAIGDQGNDVAMIEWAGLGVAMGGADHAVQAVADWVAPPLSEDGAAVAVERFLIASGLCGVKKKGY